MGAKYVFKINIYAFIWYLFLGGEGETIPRAPPRKKKQAKEEQVIRGWVNY